MGEERGHIHAAQVSCSSTATPAYSQGPELSTGAEETSKLTGGMAQQGKVLAMQASQPSLLTGAQVKMAEPTHKASLWPPRDLPPYTHAYNIRHL